MYGSQWLLQFLTHLFVLLHRGSMITHNSSQCNYFSLVTKLYGAEIHFQRYFIFLLMEPKCSNCSFLYYKSLQQKSDLMHKLYKHGQIIL